jgi:4,5:9,10-diseco-3-hydroxy-5,9,17-trioxoandrosta-1(10),2-diene-4-oate hydrolase
MARLTIDRPIILGNSIGGAAAIRFASRHAVLGLVLCDSGGLVEVTPTIVRFCQLQERFFAAGERGAWWFGPAFALYYRLVLSSPAAKAQRRRIVKGAKASAAELRQAWTSFGTAEADIRDLAASLDTPIWVAWAEGDKVIPLKRCLPAIRRLKSYTLTTFKGGHSPFLEQPDAFAEGFSAFAADLRPIARQSRQPPAQAGAP